MTIRIINGDCREMLATLPDKSVQCVVTSPPYWGLRDYGTGKWKGGDPDCDHKDHGSFGKQRGTGKYFDGGVPYHVDDERNGRPSVGPACPLCGATRVDRQIGLEPTPDEFVAQMVAVFREVRRVLRDDGVCFLNLGDSYSSGGRGDFGSFQPGTKQATHPAIKSAKRPPQPEGLKPKDLIGIPWMVAFALRADGWWLRSDIIWAKPNPMPESVTDRPTSSHEHVFLLTKSARYFYDAEAVREPTAEASASRLAQDVESQTGSLRANGGGKTNGPMKAVGKPDERNLRNVWTIATMPFAEAHFATFPPELAERCIKAGSKPGDTILDPFAGAFTTAMVADRLQRNAIGIELNQEYCDIAKRRIVKDAGMFADIE